MSQPMTVWSRVSAVSPFGPIFGKELRTTARRKRSYLLRVAYLALLLIALLLAYLVMGRDFGGGGLTQRAQQQAELGAVFFAVFSMFCVIVMGLIGPVLTSTAVGSERLAKTLPVLLMTPINTWQILGGKLFSRMLAALTLIGLSLPVLALVRLLGGVEFDQMVAVVCLCTAFALSSAAIGLFFSTLMNRAYAVILLSYVTLGIIYALAPMLIIAGFRINERVAMPILGMLHPVAATAIECFPRGLIMFGSQWHWCCVTQVAFTVLLVLASAAVLRRRARSAGESPTPTNPESLIPLAAVAVAGPPVPMPAGLPPPLPAPAVVGYAAPQSAADAPGALKVLFFGPFWVLGFLVGSGPLARKHRVRGVSNNPVLWREVSRPLFGKPWQRIVATVVTIVLLLLVYLTMASNNALDDSDSHIGFAIIMAGLAWLLMAVLSATVIAGEKESDTWTLLLAAPLSGSKIVWGKVAGLYRRMGWPLLLIVGHFLLFTVVGVLHPLSVVLVLWVTLTFNSIWVATGVWLSLRIRRVTFAVIANLMLAVVTYVMPFVVLGIYSVLTESRGDVVETGAWPLPYYWLGNGIEGLNRLYGRGRYYYGYRGYDDTRFRLPNAGHADLSEFAAAVFIVGLLHLLVSALILMRTARSFDQIVGRAGRLAYAGAFDTDEAVIPVPGLPPPVQGFEVVGQRPGVSAAPALTGVSGAFASVWRRFEAMVVDYLILGAFGGVLGFVVGVAVAVSAPDMPRGGVAEQTIWQWTILGLASTILLAWPYFAGFECSRLRATPGKILLGIFVTDEAGRRISFLRATGRYFAKLVSGAILLAGYALALVSPKRQALHDNWAGTLVLRR